MATPHITGEVPAGVPDEMVRLVQEMICSEGMLTALDIHRAVCDIIHRAAGPDLLPAGLPAVPSAGLPAVPSAVPLPPADQHAAVDQPQLHRGLSDQPQLQLHRGLSAASTASTATQTDLEAEAGSEPDSPGGIPGVGAGVEVAASLIAEKARGLRALADNSEISAATAEVLKKGLAELEALAMQLQGGGQGQGLAM